MNSKRILGKQNQRVGSNSYPFYENKFTSYSYLLRPLYDVPQAPFCITAVSARSFTKKSYVELGKGAAAAALFAVSDFTTFPKVIFWFENPKLFLLKSLNLIC